MKVTKAQKEKAIEHNLKHPDNTLYEQTTEAWGHLSEPMVWNDWLTGMIDLFADWYCEYCNEYDGRDDPCTFEEYVSCSMHDELEEVEED